MAKRYEFALDAKVQRELSQYQESSGRDLKGCAPYCVQTKKGKRINVRAAYREAASAVDSHYRIAVAHIYDDHQTPLVILSEDDWMTIVEHLKNIH